MLCLSRKRMVVSKDQPHGPGRSVPMIIVVECEDHSAIQAPHVLRNIQSECFCCEISLICHLIDSIDTITPALITFQLQLFLISVANLPFINTVILFFCMMSWKYTFELNASLISIVTWTKVILYFMSSIPVLNFVYDIGLWPLNWRLAAIRWARLNSNGSEPFAAIKYKSNLLWSIIKGGEHNKFRNEILLDSYN